MEEMNVFEMRWLKLLQALIDARQHSLRQDVEIQHIINKMAQIEQLIPDHKPQDVASLEDAE